MKNTSMRRRLAAVALGAGILAPLAFAGVANASTVTTETPTASATVTGGTLSFVSAPGNVTFPAVVLDGTDQTTAATEPIDIGDNTGSLDGWNVTATSTQFTATVNSSTYTLPSSAVTVNAAPSAVCDTGSTCTTAVESTSIVYPYALPAGATAPTATKIFDATAGTGMGNQTFTPNFTLAIPSSATAGAYSSTWTFSLVSAP
ncbi:MAG: WxL domain-containing protein [Acidimicrobiales bacterium]